MKISSVNDNNKIAYTGLKSIEYCGLFCPRRNLKDAQSVKYFLESKAFKKLFENYDVKARFLSTRLESRRGIFNNLYLFCQKIEPCKNMHSKKKIFIERIKSLFNIKPKNTNNFPPLRIILYTTDVIVLSLFFLVILFLKLSGNIISIS